MIKHFLILLVLLILAACAQAPTPGDEATDLGSLAFSGPATDMANGLAKHRTGVYVIGSTDGALDGPSAGSYDGIIRKYSASGTKLWARQFGTSRSESSSAVASDANDNAYVVGQIFDIENGAINNSNVFVRKYSPSGSVLWHRAFGPRASEETATGVAVSGGHVYVVGQTDGSLADSRGDMDAFIRKYNASGTVVWTQQFGTDNYDMAVDVAVDGNGNAYVSGHVFNEASFYANDTYIRKYSPTGSLLWNHRQRALNYYGGNAVAVSGNHVYLVSYSQPEFYDDTPNALHVFKYTTSGRLPWRRVLHLPYYEAVRDASTDPSGNLYIAGRTRSGITEDYDDDGYVRKLSASGSPLWRRRMSSPASDISLAVLAPTSDKVYVAGFTFGTLGGSTSRDDADAFLRQLSGSNGVAVWTDQ